MIGVISISKQGNALAQKIAGMLSGVSCYTLSKWQQPGFLPIEGKLSEFCGTLFSKHPSLVFVMASGIVVRSIAPWLKNKTTDPAVLVVDDAGQHVISLLSGHLGGANALALELAQKIDARPVITTASDVNGLPSVDMLAQSKNLIIDSMEDAKLITALIVNRQIVELVDEHRVFSPSPLSAMHGTCAGKIIVTNKAQLSETLPFAKLLSRNIILGIGCKKNTPPQALLCFIVDALARCNIDVRSVKTIASINIKKDETAILHAAEKLNCPLQFYSTEALQQVDGLFEGSAFVKATVGVASVSTTAAYLAGKKQGRFITQKEKQTGMTLSIFEQTS